ncbi:MAG: lipid-A-disaccharide synthase N-terminal domain-containing protein, partial [Candidatus Aminicenantes bacterium]|nr:lipid-A-disaccharide synthase N-terminal domain-containing protein [Candidatus Aminicenantes bacterium]
MNIWLIVGFLAQGFFASRFLVQWIVSEKRKESVMPLYFWYSSVFGGLLLLVYAIHILDPVFILGQSMGLLIY